MDEVINLEITSLYKAIINSLHNDSMAWCKRYRSGSIRVHKQGIVLVEVNNGYCVRMLNDGLKPSSINSLDLVPNSTLIREANDVENIEIKAALVQLEENHKEYKLKELNERENDVIKKLSDFEKF